MPLIINAPVMAQVPQGHDRINQVVSDQMQSNVEGGLMRPSNSSNSNVTVATTQTPHPAANQLYLFGFGFLVVGAMVLIICGGIKLWESFSGKRERLRLNSLNDEIVARQNKRTSAQSVIQRSADTAAEASRRLLSEKTAREPRQASNNTRTSSVKADANKTTTVSKKTATRSTAKTAAGKTAKTSSSTKPSAIMKNSTETTKKASTTTARKTSSVASVVTPATQNPAQKSARVRVRKTSEKATPSPVLIDVTVKPKRVRKSRAKTPSVGETAALT